MNKITLLFPDFKTKAFTMSFDDGHDSDIPLVELMKKYGLKGTFNLSSGLLYPKDSDVPTGHAHIPLSEKQALDLYDKDYCEVASHGYEHQALGHIGTADAMYDLLMDRRKLEGMFGTLVRGHVYPYCSYSPDVIEIARQAGFVYSRIIEQDRSFKLPAPGTWMEWKPTCHFNDGGATDCLKKFVNEPNLYYHGWLFLGWAHSFDFLEDDGFAKLEEQFKIVANNPDIWYATNIEVYEYTEAFRSLIYSADSTFVYNPTQIPVYLRYNTGHGSGQLLVPPGETVYFEI